MNQHPALEWLSHFLARIETHAALTQAVAAIISTLIAAGALIYAIRTLKALQRQTEASIALTTETFRPIVEVLGAGLAANGLSTVDFINKGNGAALNFRWRVNEEPERWGGYTTNIIAPQEKGQLRIQVEWQKGLVLSYNSVAHSDELLTYVSIRAGSPVSNSHVDTQRAVIRTGWTVIDPKLAIPGLHPDLIRSMPPFPRLRYWWLLKRGKERRL